jgi:predicted ArsR family transcriptional regulator
VEFLPKPNLKVHVVAPKPVKAAWVPRVTVRSRVLELIRETPNQTARQLADLLNLETHLVWAHLTRLKERGLLRSEDGPPAEKTSTPKVWFPVEVQRG